MKNKGIWKGFFVNMLGVILAIVLTFGVNSLWQNREEKKRTKEMLILVRNELNYNKLIFKIHEDDLKKDGYIYQKILDAKNDLASIPKDTLKKYFNQLKNLRVSPLTTSSWQIFQNSDMIQKMTDKELVIRMTSCYTGMNAWFDFIMKEYWDVKKKIMMLELDDPYRFFDKALKNNEYVFFFNMYRLDQESIRATFLGIDALIDYTIMLLDKHGDYRYDMDEKDNEINSFIKARVDSVFHKKDSINENITSP